MITHGSLSRYHPGASSHSGQCSLSSPGPTRLRAAGARGVTCEAAGNNSEAESDMSAASKPISKRRTLLYMAPVWPEPTSTAAGVRTQAIITRMQRTYDVHFLSPCKPNQHSAALERTGVHVYQCPANREARFLEVLNRVQPALCIFDRFYCEEAFSFMVQLHAPSAMRVLDMQDLHSLRNERMVNFKAGSSVPRIGDTSAPSANSPMLLREIASIMRSDLSLVCSCAEMDLLIRLYGVPEAKLVEAGLFADVPSSSEPAVKTDGSCQGPAFEDRQHLVHLGNWKHPPNFDACQWLAEGGLWDDMRLALKARGEQGTELHLYGAHATHAAQKLHDPARRIFVKGHMNDISQLAKYRLSLAPLRFGAGLKGKIVDSWVHGTPVVMTEVGAEGLHISDRQVSPVVYETNDNKSFADVAAATYCDSSLWHSMQRSGIRVLQYIALSPVQYGVLMSMQHVCWPAFANLVNASFSEFLQSYARL